MVSVVCQSSESRPRAVQTGRRAAATQRFGPRVTRQHRAGHGHGHAFVVRTAAQTEDTDVTRQGPEPLVRRHPRAANARGAVRLVQTHAVPFPPVQFQELRLLRARPFRRRRRVAHDAR